MIEEVTFIGEGVSYRGQAENSVWVAGRARVGLIEKIGMRRFESIAHSHLR